jgi:putative flavoprotein involved in K+ transport
MECQNFFNMKNTILDAIVVGAGVAGLSASYHLKKYGLDHIVFDRGRIGESWRSQRWDSFRLNSINKLNSLPGMAYEGSDAGAFSAAREYISSLEGYVSDHDLPVLENSKVISVEKSGDIFNVTVASNGIVKTYCCRNVIIASGYASEVMVPSFSKNISAAIKQLHAAEYRNAEQLPAGAVLVVGSAQSGIQIAEDLVNAGRKVYLSTSMVARVPRWYRGKDIMEWLKEMGFFDVRAQEIEDPAMLKMKPPQITGIGGSRYTISLQSLAKKGVTILGKTDIANDESVFFQKNADVHVKFADAFSKRVKEMIDGFIVKCQLPAELPQPDEADKPDENASCASSITSLNFKKDSIRSIIWATGFSGDFSYVKLPVFDDDGNLKHKNGIPVVPGLYFLGLPWLTARRSVVIFGIKDDAEFVVENICKQTAIEKKEIAI